MDGNSGWFSLLQSISWIESSKYRVVLCTPYIFSVQNTYSSRTYVWAFVCTATILAISRPLRDPDYRFVHSARKYMHMKLWIEIPYAALNFVHKKSGSSESQIQGYQGIRFRWPTRKFRLTGLVIPSASCTRSYSMISVGIDLFGAVIWTFVCFGNGSEAP